jgi:hypothetical protein
MTRYQGRLRAQLLEQPQLLLISLHGHSALLAGSNDLYDTSTINGIGVISLGITGEVYSSTKHVLTRLGVTGKANASLLNTSATQLPRR